MRIIIILIFTFVSYFIQAVEVTYKNNSMYVNGQPYYMKGICYHPVPKGKIKRNFSNLDEDINIMKEAGINTIRVYEPIDDIDVLNKLNEAGIKVIINFGYNQRGRYDILSGTLIDYIFKYQDHDAILMWELGNEYNYHPQWFGGNITTWYKVLEVASQAIKSVDSSRLVSSAHGDLPTKEVLDLAPSVDVWGLNLYRWDKPESVFVEWPEVSDKPIYFSELGADSYMTRPHEQYASGENQQAQADANKRILEKVLENFDKNIGAFVFSFTDGLWKAGNPNKQDTGGVAPNSDGTPYDGSANEEYWGIVDIYRNKKITFDVVKDAYLNFDIK